MKQLCLAFLLSLTSISFAFAAGSVERGQEKSIVCAACHGSKGLNADPNYPDLAGQHAPYIVNQLTAFKSGKRQDPLMTPMVANLSKQDMADLASYFASQPRQGIREQLATSQPTKAEPSANTTSSSNTQPDLAPSETTEPKQAKITVCTTCHGVDGNSTAAIYPKLAGQGANYLAKQLHEFKQGNRTDAVMAPMAMELSAQDIKEISAYFAALPRKSGNGQVNQLGKKLYFRGDRARTISACVACHGPQGKGVGQAGFPAVAGQNKAYLTSQLVKFQNAERNNDSNAMMRQAVKQLSQAEIEALSEFMATLK